MVIGKFKINVRNEKESGQSDKAKLSITSLSPHHSAGIDV